MHVGGRPPEAGGAALGPRTNSLLSPCQRVGADPGAGHGEPRGQVEGWQEGGQGALQQVRAAAHGVLRLAHVRTFGEEAHVVGWRAEEERAVRGGAGPGPAAPGDPRTRVGKRQEKTRPLPPAEDTAESRVLGTTCQLSGSRDSCAQLAVSCPHWQGPSLVAQLVESTCKAGDLGSIGKIPWRRAWQPAPVFLPGESHGQRRLLDYSPFGHKELDTTE